jgi:hypothetical protein
MSLDRRALRFWRQPFARQTATQIPLIIVV